MENFNIFWDKWNKLNLKEPYDNFIFKILNLLFAYLLNNVNFN